MGGCAWHMPRSVMQPALWNRRPKPMPMSRASRWTPSAPMPMTSVRRGKSKALRPARKTFVATATIDGIPTRYEVIGSGPPLLMYSPAGFDATLEKWTTQGVYASTKMLNYLSREYTCIIYDRREAGQSGGRVEHVTWAHYVAQARGLLEHLNVKRAHLMGG